ncbi:hypothetical protein GWI33_005959 [Rhynchophorus ferrugineus]|uniref:Cytochrome P450 n=1 Tax=Rhynchophorus ferrugineus TaxID=354439 RepID=A0A834J3H1_RHYFE|nr:hypothetical protein GWI33_005959 [Rhynchophorus ferrugineus]
MRKNVPGPYPLQIFGNVLPCFMGRLSFGVVYRDIYRLFEEYPAVGLFRLLTPILLARDPAFIRRILQIDADYFYDNEWTVDPRKEPLMSKNPLVQKGKKWEETTNLLRPAFFPERLKFYLTEIYGVSEKMISYIESKSSDNVTYSVFAHSANSFDSDKPKFMETADHFAVRAQGRLLFQQTLPLLSNLLMLKIIPRSTGSRFNDFMDFQLNEAERNLSSTEITGHSAMVLQEGYEITSLVLSYVLYNLARNMHCQSRARGEIEFYDQRCGGLGRMPFDRLDNLEYTNACIYESMRLCPVLHHFTRVCTKEYKYKTENTRAYFKRLDFTIEPGTPVIIPYSSFCHDPRYFISPYVFNPYRFIRTEELVRNISFPFGAGHRTCLGKDYGFMQVQIGVIAILRRYEITVNERTAKPFKYEPYKMLNKVRGGIWLNFRRLY